MVLTTLLVLATVGVAGGMIKGVVAARKAQIVITCPVCTQTRRSDPLAMDRAFVKFGIDFHTKDLLDNVRCESCSAPIGYLYLENSHVMGLIERLRVNEERMKMEREALPALPPAVTQEAPKAAVHFTQSAPLPPSGIRPLYAKAWQAVVPVGSPPSSSDGECPKCRAFFGSGVNCVCVKKPSQRIGD
jgi:hypothetical protein